MSSNLSALCPLTGRLNIRPESRAHAEMFFVTTPAGEASENGVNEMDKAVVASVWQACGSAAEAEVAAGYSTAHVRFDEAVDSEAYATGMGAALSDPSFATMMSADEIETAAGGGGPGGGGGIGGALSAEDQRAAELEPFFFGDGGDSGGGDGNGGGGDGDAFDDGEGGSAFGESVLAGLGLGGMDEPPSANGNGQATFFDVGGGGQSGASPAMAFPAPSAMELDLMAQLGLRPPPSSSSSSSSSLSQPAPAASNKNNTQKNRSGSAQRGGHGASQAAPRQQQSNNRSSSSGGGGGGGREVDNEASMSLMAALGLMPSGSPPRARTSQPHMTPAVASLFEDPQEEQQRMPPPSPPHHHQSQNWQENKSGLAPSVANLFG